MICTYCVKCGNALSDGAKFCTSCGNRLEEDQTVYSPELSPPQNAAPHGGIRYPENINAPMPPKPDIVTDNSIPWRVALSDTPPPKTIGTLIASAIFDVLLLVSTLALAVCLAVRILNTDAFSGALSAVDLDSVNDAISGAGLALLFTSHTLIALAALTLVFIFNIFMLNAARLRRAFLHTGAVFALSGLLAIAASLFCGLFIDSAAFPSESRKVINTFLSEAKTLVLYAGLAILSAGVLSLVAYFLIRTLRSYKKMGNVGVKLRLIATLSSSAAALILCVVLFFIATKQSPEALPQNDLAAFATALPTYSPNPVSSTPSTTPSVAPSATPSATTTPSAAAITSTPLPVTPVPVNPDPYSQKIEIVSMQGSPTWATLTLSEWQDGSWVQMYTTTARVGSNGISDNYGEGKKITPKGTYNILFCYGLTQPESALRFKQLYSDSVFVDDSSSAYYNTIVSSSILDSSVSRENTYSQFQRGIYNVNIFFDYNGDGETANSATAYMGSVYTLCGYTQTLGETLGCIDISSEDMTEILKILDSSKSPVIIIS